MKRLLLVLLGSLLIVGAACGDDGGTATGAGSTDPGSEAPTGEPSEEEEPTEEPSPEIPGGELDVTGVDFAFKVDPPTISAGKTEVRFTNDGKEKHQLLMARLIDGAPSLDKLITLPEKKGDAFVEKGYSQAAEPIPPGESTSFTANFPAGRYVLVCFVPNEDGPHAFHGMVSELMIE